METMVIINGKTSHRANVIMSRTGSAAMGVVKSQLIDPLKVKLHNGVAHFMYQKKNGKIREAWGTTSSNLMQAKINGNGILRDSVNCVAYWDIEKSAFRSLRFESLIAVY